MLGRFGYLLSLRDATIFPVLILFALEFIIRIGVSAPLFIEIPILGSCLPMHGHSSKPNIGQAPVIGPVTLLSLLKFSQNCRCIPGAEGRLYICSRDYKGALATISSNLLHALPCSGLVGVVVFIAISSSCLREMR